MFIYVTNHEGQKPKINITQIVAVIEKTVYFASGMALDLDDESIKEIHRLTDPKDKQTKQKDADPELLALFTELHKLTGGKGKPVFSLQREKKLKDLMDKHRMTKEDLIRAATNVGLDAFLQGENDNNKRYGDVDYLLRPDKAAKYADASFVPKKKKMF